MTVPRPAPTRAPFAPAPPPRLPVAAAFSGLTWTGFVALFEKEVRRFLAVWVQTVIGPAISALLFVAIFVVILRDRALAVGGHDYLAFVAPGLVMMAMLQNAFANTSSSILSSKNNGTIVDILMAPLGALELVLGYALAAVVRAVIVGGLVAGALVPLGAMTVAHVWPVIGFGFGASLLFAQLGILGGVIATKMEHNAFLATVVVAPLTILSGTFYAVSSLPHPLREIAAANPVFFLIDGFRAGFLGVAESDPAVGLAVMGGANALLFGLLLWMFAIGYRLKA